MYIPTSHVKSLFDLLMFYRERLDLSITSEEIDSDEWLVEMTDRLNLTNRFLDILGDNLDSLQEDDEYVNEDVYVVIDDENLLDEG